MDARHRRGKVKVPERKKAIPAVTTKYRMDLERLGEAIRPGLEELAADPLGASRREQEALSKLGNWAGYRQYPPPAYPGDPFWELHGEGFHE